MLRKEMLILNLLIKISKKFQLYTVFPQYLKKKKLFQICVNIIFIFIFHIPNQKPIKVNN